ncbi:hypothetical protein BP951000_0178 [Brachyspira pilosicoli 95/1000]|uniref:Uncharacterized protein n=1 Tax=Brachyspira pilosicoli (strain ATCC BAA-1826 / 95/1000) TaxID=759914 RepID=D8IAK4_BRAP9|nr:hypothetical protein BP951000_0178 [Brachyspira pilosicoli 95/1000]
MRGYSLEIKYYIISKLLKLYSKEKVKVILIKYNF